MKGDLNHEAHDKAERKLIAMAFAEGSVIAPNNPVVTAISILTMALAETIAIVSQRFPDPAAFVEETIPEIATAVRDTAAAMKPEGSC